MTVPKNPWLQCYAPRPDARARVVCFPHAGGSPTAFATWHRDLPPEIEVSAVLLPGRDARRAEPFCADVGALAGELVAALRPLHDRPVVLFGYSLGALVAFECARALRAAGVPAPAHLFVLARRAPQLPAEPPVHDLPQDRFIDETTRRYGGIPQAILEDADMLAYFLPTIRADLKLVANYRFAEGAPLACPVTAIGGDTDSQTSAAALDAWRAHTTGPFDVQTVPGGHFFIAQPQVRRAVLDRVISAAR